MATNFYDSRADELVRCLLQAPIDQSQSSSSGDGNSDDTAVEPLERGGEESEDRSASSSEGRGVGTGGDGAVARAGSVEAAFSRRRGLRKRFKRKLQQESSDDYNNNSSDSERSLGDIER